MKRYIAFLILLLFALPAYATTSTINPAVPAANSPLSSSVMRNNFGAAYNDINALWAAIAAGATVTWPTSGYVVLSNGTNSPAGVAEVDGDCLKGVAGVWVTGACGSGGSGLVVGTTTITSGTNGDVEYNNNGVLGELSSATTVNGQSCALGGACTATAAAGTLTGTTLNSTVVSSSLTSLGTIATGVWHGTKVGLAYGGTNADLSATGGTSEVLKQVSSGAAVTVAQLACSDLSNAAASCSTNATDASNISSGLLASTLGGTGVDNSGTITVGGNVAFSGAHTFAGTLTGNTAVTFPTSGTLSTTTGTVTSVTFTGDGTVLSSTPSSAVTTTGTLTATLANQTANTLLGALTATTPSDIGVPSCVAATKALNWTSGTGFTCNSSITATTNANLTGPITSSGNATALASQTGTGTKFVVDTSPTIVTPTITILDNALTIEANGDTSKTLAFNLAGETTGKAVTLAFSNALAATFTYPAATDTLVGRASTDTLTNKSIAGSEINSSLVAATYGGTGVDNTATLTLGSSNQNWATLGTGIVKNTTTTGAITDAASSDIIALFSGCSGSEYLGADGACHSASGAGTVTSVTFTGDGTILSSTPSSAVTTSGTLTATLANQTANTVLGALTATTPSDLGVPSCSATGDALKWTSGTGFGCFTGYAPLASPTFSGTVTAPDSSTWTSSGIGSLAALGVGETAPAAGIINVSSKYEVGGSQISCSSLSNGATGCSTATGTSGGTIPLLNGANTWSGAQTITKSDLLLLGSSTGYTTLNSGLSSTSNTTLTLPTTSSDTLAALGTAETWTALQKMTNADFGLLGSSTGYTLLESGLGSTSNNTLTLPTTSSDTLAALGTAETWTAAQTFTNADLLLKGSSSGAMTLEAPAAASTYIMTFPAATDTVTGIAATQTLTNKSIAGSEINSGLVAATYGGTGVDNTATLTLGSSNVNLATLGTGIVKNTTTTGALTDAASADIIALFSTCSGSQYLGADGSCHTASGAGTVTSVATNAGLTGGTITTSGTIGLASIANNSALCNNSGGSADPETANCTVTGTGNLVLASSPTLTTAALGSSTATTQTANTNNTDVATTAYVDRVNLKQRTFGVSFDGGGSALTSITRYAANVPCNGTITGVYLVGSPSGSIVVDIWKIAAGSSLPTVTNTITASDLPTLSSATVYTDTTLTGWTTTVTAGDMMGYKINSATTITNANLMLVETCN